MIVPLVAYDFTAVLIAFALIGIGNTLLQVSLNPLVTNVIAGDKLTGTLTLGQFVKAVSSFLGPIIAAAVTGSFLGWKMIFPIYAAISLLALIWLWLTPIAEQKVDSADISIGHTFSLLKDKYIVAFFIGILVLVGVDVGMGITFPKLLMERCNLPLTDAGMGQQRLLFRTHGRRVPRRHSADEAPRAQILHGQRLRRAGRSRGHDLLPRTLGRAGLASPYSASGMPTSSRSSSRSRCSAFPNGRTRCRPC